jgi:hypothetical protein
VPNLKGRCGGALGLAAGRLWLSDPPCASADPARLDTFSPSHRAAGITPTTVFAKRSFTIYSGSPDASTIVTTDLADLASVRVSRSGAAHRVSKYTSPDQVSSLAVDAAKNPLVAVPVADAYRPLGSGAEEGVGMVEDRQLDTLSRRYKTQELVDGLLESPNGHYLVAGDSTDSVLRVFDLRSTRKTAVAQAATAPSGYYMAATPSGHRLFDIAGFDSSTNHLRIDVYRMVAPGW